MDGSMGVDLWQAGMARLFFPDGVRLGQRTRRHIGRGYAARPKDFHRWTTSYENRAYSATEIR